MPKILLGVRARLTEAAHTSLELGKKGLEGGRGMASGEVTTATAVDEAAAVRV